MHASHPSYPTEAHLGGRREPADGPLASGVYQMQIFMSDHGSLKSLCVWKPMNIRVEEELKGCMGFGIRPRVQTAATDIIIIIHHHHGHHHHHHHPLHSYHRRVYKELSVPQLSHLCGGRRAGITPTLLICQRTLRREGRVRTREAPLQSLLGSPKGSSWLDGSLLLTEVKQGKEGRTRALRCKDSERKSAGTGQRLKRLQGGER